MHKYVNSVKVQGTIDNIEELRWTKKRGVPVLNLVIVTFSKESPNNPQYHKITAYGALAERAADYDLDDTLFVAGELKTKSWESKEGDIRSRVEIKAKIIKLIEGNIYNEQEDI